MVSGLLFIVWRALSEAGFPVVSPRAVIRCTLCGTSNARRATAADGAERPAKAEGACQIQERNFFLNYF